jgi:monoamine oxidase
MPLTRRTLLSAMAKFGGAGAVTETLAAWDFLKPSPAVAAALSLPADAGKGRTVAILGAGVSGLCSAYELDRAGYDCVILEPQRRAGGRSLTLRRGDTFREMGDSPLQTCEFDEGLWLNAGPGRIPHSHVNVIDYCRRFGVALQPYIFASRANLVHSSKLGNGRTIQVRQALYDLQGLVAELADKCIAKGGLDLPVTGVELERLHEMLAQFGNLTKTVTPGNAPSYSYQNKSGHAGYEVSPGSAYQPGKPLSPLKLEEILRSNVWNDWIFRDADYFWQTSLMEPVGGMDMFAKSFLRQPLTRQSGAVDGLIRYGARVTAIENASDKVTVQYQDGNSARTLEADYCISTIPMPVFVTLKTNLPNDVMTAAANLPAMVAGKVGWQADRFWEVNDNIYGGISWTDEAIDQIWYPSSGYLSAKGTLTGAYMRGKHAEEFNALTVAERLSLAREQGERLHPGAFAKSVEHGVAIGWNHMEFARMGWANESDPQFGANAQVLSKPQGRFHFAGDQVTFWTGWQEGAVIAAHMAVQSIDQQNNPTSRRG